MTAPTRDAIAAVAPYYRDEAVTLLHGDALAMLRTLPDASVQCVVTSPPYHNLRDYGTPGQIGLESTLDDYVAALVAVFREVRRVMRRDAVLWLNLGDTLADKQLQGVPWRVAFALQADGFYLRSEVIWAKSNPMPESVDDRPTKAHEQVFLLSKSADYFYDAAAVAEPVVKGAAGSRFDTGKTATHQLWRASTTPREDSDNRNKRSVWTISTTPFPGSHFAVMPEALATPCVLAGTSERGACPTCGTPWRRVLAPIGGRVTSGNPRGERRAYNADRQDNGAVAFTVQPTRTAGWEAGCRCGHATTVPCVVLDPFSGSGTTVAVAKRLGRHGIGIDLNADYHRLATRRLAQSVMQLEGAAG